MPTGRGLNSIVWTGERLVATGGVVITSSDGIEWTVKKTETNVAGTIVWNGSLFAVAGVSGILTSPDGVNWTTHEIDFGEFGFTGISLRSIIWTNSQFVAVGYGNLDIGGLAGFALTSPNGSEWTFHEMDVFNTYIFDVTWSDLLQMLVVVGGHETILTSPDGIDWAVQNQEGAINNYLTSVAWTGSRFVAMGSSGSAGVLYTSEDGVTWIRGTTGTEESISDVFWTGPPDSGGLGLVAVGSGSGVGGPFLTSPDGLSWTFQSRIIGRGQSIAWTGEQLVVVGGNSNIVTSPDGVNWTQRSSGVTSRELYDVTWAPGIGAVAVGDDAILTSPDGVEWTFQLGWPPLRIGRLLSVAWADGVGFIAGGFDGKLLTSTDALTWERHDVGTFNDCITWMGDKFIMAGAADTIRLSPDGINWTTESKGLPALVQGMVWTGEQVVAVGQAGVILTSPDGVYWTVRDSGGTGNVLYDLVWTGEQLVAVGYRGLVMTSPDGVTWMEQNSGTTETLLSVTSSGSWLVAVGRTSGNSSNGMAYASSDGGVTWHAYPTGTFNTLHSVTWSDDKFIAVGYDGNILTALEDEPLFVQKPQVSFDREIFLRVGRNNLFYSLPSGQTTVLKSQEIRTLIYTLSGQRVLANKQIPIGNQGEIFIGHLPPGPYLLELMVGRGNYSSAFTVTR